MHKASAVTVTLVIVSFISSMKITRGMNIPLENQGLAYLRGQVARASPMGPADARTGWPKDLKRISFDREAGYLIFPSEETFAEALDSLEAKVKNFKFDKGQTSYLMGLIRNSSNSTEVGNMLMKYSPLSEEVLIAFLNKRFPAELVKQVLEVNIQFSEKVEAAYRSTAVTQGVRDQIDQQRLKNIAYDDPALVEFEDGFTGFESLRKKRLKEETAFLANGADPESPRNPANAATAVDDVLAAVLNKYNEVRIGVDVYVALPGKDIRVAGANKRILNYLRTNGDIPRNRIPTREPANGLLKTASPPPIDPGIEVEPNAKYNTNCGAVSIGGANDGTGRLSFDIRGVRNTDFQYYWDFGDGFVSYKRNPTHKYLDGQTSHKAGVTVYGPMGTTCNPSGSGTGVSTPGGACAAVLQVAGTNGLNVSFAALSIYGTPPFTHIWDFGDTTTANTGVNNSPSHTYSHGGTYGVTVTIVDSSLCSATSFGGVSVSANPPNLCDNRDKEKEIWTSPDKTHKFKHKFKMKNFLNTPSRIKAIIRPHYKGFLNIWWPDSTACTISIYGYVYTSITDPCDTETALNIPTESDTKFVLRAGYTFGMPSVSVKPNKAFTTATAYGGTSTLSFQ
jgi:hypothetical protein